MGAAIFTPSSVLDANKTYTATVSAGITDLLGNSLGSDYNWMFKTVMFGDINGDGSVDLFDAVLALRFLSGLEINGIRDDYASSGVDVNGEKRLRMEEVLYIMQKVAGMR